MAEVIKRLKKDSLPPKEFKYVSDYPQWEIYWAYKEKETEAKIERLKKKTERVQEKLLKVIERLLVRGDDIPSIADLLELSIDETVLLVKQIQSRQL